MDQHQLNQTAAPTTDRNPRRFDVSDGMVFAIALPMTIAFTTTPLLGLVDTAVIGQLDNAALLGGLAIAAVIFDLIFTTFNFLRASTTGLVAQATGAGEKIEEQAVLVRALIVACVCGMVLVAVGPWIMQLVLLTMAASPAVSGAVHDYFAIRILAAPLTLANYAILGWLIGLGKAGTGLAVQTVLNGVNIILSLTLGLYLGYGIQGVAWATFCGEAAGLVFGGLLVFLHFDRKSAPSRTRVLDRIRLLRLFAVNRDIIIRSFCLVFAFAFFTAQGSHFGEVTLAANAILMNFFIVSGYFLDGLATAAEQLVGRSIGARYRPAFDRAVFLSMKWGVVLAVALTALFWIAGPSLIDLLTVNEAVRAEARSYLVWAVITGLAGVAAFQMDGVFIGATWSTDMRNMMLLSLGVYVLVWFVAVPVWGNHGLWMALEVFLAIRGVTLWWRMKVRATEEFASA